MSILTISRPANGAHLPLEAPVSFVGTATGGVTRVVVTADEEFALGEAVVDPDGGWTLTRQFSVGAQRKITVTGFDAAGDAMETDALTIVLVPSTADCSTRVVLFSVTDGDTGKVTRVFKLPGTEALFFLSGMTICVDGSPNAYCPDDKGLDALKNARRKDGSLSPDVIVFGADDKPVIGENGCFISQTALQDATKSRTNPSRYVDAERIPFIVLPGIPKVGQNGLVPGDLAAVFHKVTQKLVFAICADVGPSDHIGEGSLFLAKELGFTKKQQNARTGGVDKGIFYVAFPGSRQSPRWSATRTPADIAHSASPLFEAWGGLTRLKSCFSDIG